MTARSFIITSAIALTFALAGCGDDPVAPGPSPSTSRATASPSLTGPVAPVLPEAAKVNTPEGAEAFVRHWFEALTYAIHTGDTEPADSIAAPECDECAAMTKRLRGIYEPGGRIEGGGWIVDDLGAYPGGTDGRPRFIVYVDQRAQRLINEKGGVVSRTKPQRFALRVTVRWQDKWHTLALERVE